MTESEQKQFRLKSLAIIVATLVIGMILGGLITTRIVNKRIDRISSLHSEHGFARLIERSIHFDDDQQREEVSAILERTSKLLFEKRRVTQRQMHSILDSAKNELQSVLSEEQMARLEERLERGRRHQKKKRKREHRKGTRDPAPDR